MPLLLILSAIYSFSFAKNCDIQNVHSTLLFPNSKPLSLIRQGNCVRN
jgi:hypothetical protein